MTIRPALYLVLCIAASTLGCKSSTAGSPPAAEDIKDTPTGAPTYRTAVAFKGLDAFERPVDIQHAGDGTHRVFVVEQPGVIKVFDGRAKAPKATVFLDLRSKISAGGERGLLGLAFHPKFKDNGAFFVNYTAPSPLRTVIARIEAKGGAAADPSTHQVLMEIPQPYSNHNGGGLDFGPDGKLYIGVGDGGSAGDPHDHGSNRETLLGNILRIDVDTPDKYKKYGIPKDNPFVGNKEAWREEIYAWGLRNPWRISFDSKTGELWTGDVGQNAIEEVDRIVKGGNYGWPTLEGTACYRKWCDDKGMEPPVTQYTHKLGVSITGGVVYRGKRLSGLEGRYIYGDYVTGRIWSVRQSGKTAPEVNLLTKSTLNISTFGTTEDGQLLIADHSRGEIYRLSLH